MSDISANIKHSLYKTPLSTLHTHLKCPFIHDGTNPANGAIGAYDSIIVYESNRLPENVDMIVMLKESVAQPWLLSDYAPEKIPFDDAIALENFVYSGRKTLVPEAIIYDASGTVSL